MNIIKVMKDYVRTYETGRQRIGTGFNIVGIFYIGKGIELRCYVDRGTMLVLSHNGYSVYYSSNNTVDILNDIVDIKIKEILRKMVWKQIS